jgi:hypothetical protein
MNASLKYTVLCICLQFYQLLEDNHIDVTKVVKELLGNGSSSGFRHRCNALNCQKATKSLILINRYLGY